MRRWHRQSCDLKAYLHDRLHVSPDIEVSDDVELSRREQFFEVVEDEVRHGLVGYGPIPEGVEVELQGLQLHDLFVRDIG